MHSKELISILSVLPYPKKCANIPIPKREEAVREAIKLIKEAKGYEVSKLQSSNEDEKHL